MKKYITFGLGEFNISKFEKPINRPIPHNKPIGGLWASPIDSEFGWDSWCKGSEYYKNGGLDNFFTFTFTEDARILVVNSVSDVPEEVISRVFVSDFSFHGIDFEKLIELGYDAIELTLQGLRESNNKHDFKNLNFIGWDCESILVLNPEKMRLI